MNIIITSHAEEKIKEVLKDSEYSSPVLRISFAGFG